MKNISFQGDIAGFVVYAIVTVAHKMRLGGVLLSVLGLCRGLEAEDNAFYASSPVASITANDVTTYYASLADAVADAANNATNAVRLLAADDSAVALSNKTIIFEDNGYAFSGTLSGNGTLVITNTPSATAWSKERFSASSWNGTLVLKNVTQASFDLSNYGTSNSTVRITGCRGGFAEATFDGTLDLQDDGEVKAFTVTQASTGTRTTFARVTGLGSFFANHNVAQTYVFTDPTDFCGTIIIPKNHRSKVVLGDDTGLDIKTGMIAVATNITITVGNTWTASKLFCAPDVAISLDLGDALLAADSIPLIEADSFAGVENVTLDRLEGYYLEVVDGVLYASLEPEQINTDLTAISGPQAVAVWDGNFSTNALTAYSAAGYTLVNSNATHGLRMSSVTVDQDNQGLMFDSENALSGLTVLVRYSNLTNDTANNRVLFTSSVTSSNYYDRTGIQLKPDGKLLGIWNGSTISNANEDSGEASGSIPSSGVMAFTYSTDGTYLYYGDTAKNIGSTAVWSGSGLKSSGDAEIYGAGIGGMYRGGSKNGAEAAKGMIIEAVAVFDHVLSVKEMNGFIWPSYEIGTINVSFESFSGEGTEASLTLMTTKSLDELIDAGLVTNGFESVESALAHKDDSGLYGWQKMVLGMSTDSDEKLFAAPVQNASPTSLSFKLGNYRANSNFSNKTAKFQVYEVTNTGEAVKLGVTSGEEFVDAASTASVDLSGVNRVKFFRIKIRFE